MAEEQTDVEFEIDLDWPTIKCRNWNKPCRNCCKTGLFFIEKGTKTSFVLFMVGEVPYK